MWALHYVREEDPGNPEKAGPIKYVRPHSKKNRLLESAWSLPYDPAVRYANKGKTQWVGYKVHLSESCDENLPHFLTHVLTTTAPFS